MIKVGITGGIGSGKSIACGVFSILGIPVYYADDEARRLAETDAGIREQLISVAGAGVYNESGLNRTYLSDLIFNDRLLLDRVNQIIHPKVEEDFRNWTTHHKDSPYVLHESAILFESFIYTFFDKIVAVTAPEEIRIKRVLTRKNMTLEKITKIMLNQLSEKEITKRADYIIVNDDHQLIIPQILKLHQLFTSQ